MWSISNPSSAVCLVAAWTALLCAVLAVVPLLRADRRLVGVGLRVALPPFVLGLAVRFVAPWGPHTASGRDLGYLDDVLVGPSEPHTHLMAAVYGLLSWLPDPLRGLEVAQIVLGAASCGLIGIVTYQLCRREGPALAAGLLGALLVALARADAGPTAEVTLRLFLLLSASLVLLAVRTGSAIALLGAAGATVATAYGRLETLIVVPFLFLWAAFALLLERRAREENPDTPRLGWLVLLALGTAVLTLVWRGFLLVGLAAAVAELWRQKGFVRLSRLQAWAAAGVTLALVPRVLEVLSLERQTDRRFPMSLLMLFGNSHLLPFNPWLCSTVVPALMVVALSRLRRDRSRRQTDGHVLAFVGLVGLPMAGFYTVFMGDSSTIIKLQGIGILLLLPLAGLGAELVHALWARRTGRPVASAVALLAVLGGATLALGWGALLQVTTIQAEYRFLEALGTKVPPGTRIHHLPRMERYSLLGLPRVLAERARVVFLPLTRGVESPDIRKGDLVYLGAGCWRFLDSEVLPGQKERFRDLHFRKARERPLYWWPLSIWDLNRASFELMDGLRVKARPECRDLERRLGLEPLSVVRAARSDLEGRIMPRRVTFGLYRVTRLPHRSSAPPPPGDRRSEPSAAPARGS